MPLYEIADPAEVAEIIASYAKPAFRELVTIGKSLGRYSFYDMAAPFDYPSYDRSRMDGFACRRDSDFKKKFIVKGDISAADRFGECLAINECVRIATGAKIPETADTVIKLEDSNEVPGGVFLHIYSDAEHNIEKTGSAIKAGDIIIPENAKIDHRHIETLASFRINTLYVRGMRRVGILSTGSEITSRFSQDDMTINSNYYALSSLLKTFGVPHANLGVCPDDKERLKTLISEGIDNFDAFVTFGGTAFSRYDLMREALEGIGGEIIVDGLSASPGKTFRFGTANGKPFFVFPGTPQAAVLCGEVFLVSWLRAGVKEGSGFTESEISFNVNKKAGFSKLIPCFSKAEGGKFVSYGRSETVSCSMAMRTVVFIPPESESVKAGDMVKTFLVC